MVYKTGTMKENTKYNQINGNKLEKLTIIITKVNKRKKKQTRKYK